jgi:hypothetical protein
MSDPSVVCSASPEKVVRAPQHALPDENDPTPGFGGGSSEKRKKSENNARALKSSVEGAKCIQYRSFRGVWGIRRRERNFAWEAAMTEKKKPQRADGQMTGLAGELFVAAELLKRGFQTSVTFGNAKAIDLFAFNAKTGRTFTVQVKAIRQRNYFPLAHDRIEAGHVYVFVILNKPGQAVRYFIVSGAMLLDDQARFGKWLNDPKFPGIEARVLEDFEDRWDIFEA